MERKLTKIFRFLQENREYNKKVQEYFYNSTITPYSNKIDKITSLLYDIANTQSQPKIDYLAEFHKYVFQNRASLNSFTEFVKVIAKDKEVEANYRELYKGLRNSSGWGDKTAALFVKTIFHLHNNKYSEQLKIWSDAPSEISSGDEFYLPVDSVIIAIFKKIAPEIRWDFNKINKKLKETYVGNDIEVWDDLWFWGFITQNGTGDNRIFQWNENKYWTLKESQKESQKIKEIRRKAEIFLSILLK